MSETVHKFDSSILREYDIRGVVGTTLHVADARAIGRTFGTLVRRKGGKKVALGYDGRLSSPELAAACTEGLVAAGCDVVQIGVAATPMLYFSVYHLEADGGIMITGSHNPPDYNGFKMMMGKKSFFGADITKLGEMAGKGDYETGKGAVGVSIRAVVDKLPGKHYVLNEKVDGTFPAHHPDPTVPKNLEQLVAEVKRHGCDLGIAFDGDGDRIGAVDGKGRILWGDQLLILWARDVLKDHPGATIIADVKASQALFDEVLRAGGTPLMWKTGHSLIKTKMAELKSPLAGEMSGHVFFADTFYGFDDALYCGLRLLNIVANARESLATMRDKLPQLVNTPELRFDCADDRKFKVVEEVKARLRTVNAKLNDIDGVRVNTPDGWWLLRASNTQPVLVARCESANEAGLERLKADLKEALAPSGLELPDEASTGHH